jgi:hypothetical protein
MTRLVDKVTLGQVFSEYFGFPCQSIFHQFVSAYPEIRLKERMSAVSIFLLLDLFTANHDNTLTEELYANGPVTRRLNRTWPQNLINQ